MTTTIEQNGAAAGGLTADGGAVNEGTIERTGSAVLDQADGTEALAEPGGFGFGGVGDADAWLCRLAALERGDIKAALAVLRGMSSDCAAKVDRETMMAGDLVVRWVRERWAGLLKKVVGTEKGVMIAMGVEAAAQVVTHETAAALWDESPDAARELWAQHGTALVEFGVQRALRVLYNLRAGECADCKGVMAADVVLLLVWKMAGNRLAGDLHAAH